MSLRASFASRFAAAFTILVISFSLHGGSTGSSALHTPNGRDAGTSNGDYISAAPGGFSGGMGQPHRYFIEVPPGLSRLMIEMFDADTGLGGATEDTAGRDRDRGGYNSTFTYELVGPDAGVRNTAWDTSNSTQPAGSDDAWTTFFDANGGESFADSGAVANYSTNTGNRDFAGSWFEAGDGGGGAGGGDIQANGGSTGFTFEHTEVDDSLSRTANLSGFTSATLSFQWAGTGMGSDDAVVVEALDAVGGNVTQLGGPYRSASGIYTSVNVAIPANRITSTTTIRFRTSQQMESSNIFYVRNVRIVAGPIPAGHWEVRIASTGGDDINAIGLRAHDGNSGAGGTELNVYFDSFAAIGANPPPSGTNPRDYDLYPYVTSGCSCWQNDFDVDSNSGTTGTMSFTSRDGSFTQSYAAASLSENNEWHRNAMTGWTSDQQARGYGIWSQELTIRSYLVGGTPNGNYATIWNSNFAAAATPSANPQANAFRTYLPTDASTAPAKPYLEQVVTARGAAPVIVGQTKRFTITVKVVNPTAHPITFSAANLVTANVPGGGAVYGGNAMVAQGSITSQPAVGGTGNLTWNPGALAAGSTAILAYDVSVTPTSAGQRIPVTATAASGTRATWLDETGNATQARATFTFGPLCELAVTENLVTPVVVAAFDVIARGNQIDVEWETAGEIGTVGFNVYRISERGPIKVNDELVPSPGAPQGSRYRVSDGGTSSVQNTYLIEEITAVGEKNIYGPYAAGLSGRASDVPAGHNDYTAAPRGKAEARLWKATAQKKDKPVALLAGVRTTGLVRIAATDLSSELSVPIASIQSDLRKGRFAVSDNGAPVPWFAGADGSLVFYGRKGDTIYSNERIYRIEPAKKDATMDVVRVAPATGPVSTFPASLDIEEDRFAALVLPLDASSDYWFWESVIPGVSGYDRKVVTFDAPELTEGETSLEVRLQGAMKGLAHRATVRLNGAFLGEIEFNSLDATTKSFDVTGSLLRVTGNQLELGGVAPAGSAYDVYYFDGIRVRYPRIASAGGAALDLVASGGDALVVSDVVGDAIVLDISNPSRPALLTGAAMSGGNVALIAPRGSQAIHVASASAIRSPSSLRTTGAAQLKRRNSADYVVIAPASLSEAAESLADLRQRDGLSTMTVDLEQIYDEFAGGNATPLAIRDFIAWTQSSWSRPPKYFVLAGGGTYDYRELTKSAGLIPPIMSSTPSGIFAADSLFGDVRGNDGVPDVAIGRIPVSTNDELASYVVKLQNESTPGPMLFTSDARDRGADFKAASNAIGNAAVPSAKSFIAIDDLGVAGARNALISRWQQGASFVNWFGHGGLDRFSASLLTSADVPLLHSGGDLPVVIAMTCSLNRFEIGDVKSLGAELVNAADGGALAVWSSSGSSVHGEAVALGTELMKSINAAPNARVGDLFLAALSGAPRGTQSAGIYLLLGDPALRLSLPLENTAVNPIATGE